ncbi:hypothetical protein HYH03_015612 [Edaphochlamys debaryana]|uniref:Uncharacterized protein n=1 Tax=Edaphochlamys debaryana TaxID=47281 RepID=A0A835XLI6_9CHLO|nr:hypothetical protein HYH03_015612 [Edaphochlamys debaryana]|eukprot:KAG2485640.1 hypothetical protein HYH03_015612 [Edaphochlamys debaryana]
MAASPPDTPTQQGAGEAARAAATGASPATVVVGVVCGVVGAALLVAGAVVAVRWRRAVLREARVMPTGT